MQKCSGRCFIVIIVLLYTAQHRANTLHKDDLQNVKRSNFSGGHKILFRMHDISLYLGTKFKLNTTKNAVFHWNIPHTATNTMHAMRTEVETFTEKHVISSYPLVVWSFALRRLKPAKLTRKLQQPGGRLHGFQKANIVYLLTGIFNSNVTFSHQWRRLHGHGGHVLPAFTHGWVRGVHHE